MRAYLDAARTAIERCRWIASRTEHDGCITRTFLSPPMRDVHDHLRSWMEALGMSVRVDAAGNLRGTTGPGPAVLIGSHLDTVPDAGAYTSDAALTDSTVAASSPLAMVRPSTGTSTNTTSPNWLCAYSEMPTVPMSPSTSIHSWSSV